MWPWFCFSILWYQILGEILEIFPKVSQIYSRNTKFSKILPIFLLMWWCVNHNGYLEKGFNKRNNDETKRIESNEKAYDKKYQNGHATSLEPLNKGWMSKQSIVKCLGNLR